MASPTEGVIQTQFGLAIQILDETHKFARLNAKNVQGMYDGLVDVIKSDYAADITNGIDTHRTNVSDLMATSLGQAMLDPHLLTYGKLLNFPETAPLTLLQRLYQDFKDNSKTVQTRGFTFGNPVAGGSNAGNGALYRLNKDRGNFDIENQTPDAKVVECISDDSSGATKHRESFEIRGGEPPRDFVAGFAGGQRVGTLDARSADDSAAVLTNPSFANVGEGTDTNPTEITGWTPKNNIANFEIDRANTYRPSTAEGTNPGALKIKSADGMIQKFSLNNATFSEAIPYYIQCAVNITAGTAVGGSFILKMGNKQLSTLLTALPAPVNGWSVVQLPLTTDRWFENWNEENPGVEVEWTGATSGTLLVDDIVLAPMQFFDGGWYTVVGGATPFLFEDSFTFTDSVASEAIINYWLWRIYGLYLPSSGTPTWAEPT